MWVEEFDDLAIVRVLKADKNREKRRQQRPKERREPDVSVDS